MATIVFISNLDTDEKAHWLSLIRQQLPKETILEPKDIDKKTALEVDIAIVAKPDVSILKRFKNLIWIQSLWAGVDSLIEMLKKHQKPKSSTIKLVRLVDPQLEKTMAEAVIAWTLYLHRNMPEYAQQQTTKKWRQLPNIAAEDVRISILGAGKLGQAALTALKPLNFQLNCWSQTKKELNNINCFFGEKGLNTILQKTDILVCLLPLTKETKDILNAKTLGLLPNGAKLINFSRGAVVDTKALSALLEYDHLAHAVLDVFEQEPLPQNDSMWNNQKITILPHISAPTNYKTAATVVTKNINNYRLHNIIPEAVNLNKGY